MTSLQTPLQVEQRAVERARAALAQTLGVEDQAIRLTDRRWLDLLGEGVISSVHVGHWTARARLVAGDLGLPVTTSGDELAGDLLSLGVKRLLPRRYFTDLQTAAGSLRDCLYQKSLACHWGYCAPCGALLDR